MLSGDAVRVAFEGSSGPHASESHPNLTGTQRWPSRQQGDLSSPPTWQFSKYAVRVAIEVGPSGPLSTFCPSGYLSSVTYLFGTYMAFPSIVPCKVTFQVLPHGMCTPCSAPRRCGQGGHRGRRSWCAPSARAGTHTCHSSL